MGKKKNYVFKMEFDHPELMAAFKQIMTTGQEPMALHLKRVLEQVGVESDPALYIKEDAVIFKMINTDKGFVFAYEDTDQKKLVSKPYKLVADNEIYMTLNSGTLLVWFKRNGSPDQNVDNMVAFDDINRAVESLKLIDDPIVVAERIKQRDIEDGIIDEDGKPLPQDGLPKLSFEDAIPKTK